MGNKKPTKTKEALENAKEAINEAEKALEVPTNGNGENKLAEAKALRETVNAFILGQDLAKKLTKEQMELCIQTAMAFNLNPLKREIHFVPRYDSKTGKYSVNVLIGYEVYLKRAAHTGKLNGWGVEIVGIGKEMNAVVTIYIKGWEHPFTHQVYLDEVHQPNSPVWAKMPRFMLKKAAISQAFRLAFPEDLGGMPYTAEEMGIGQIQDGQLIEEKKPEPIKPKIISNEKAKHIESLFVLKGKEVGPILEYFKVTELADLNEKQAEVVIQRLNSFPDKDQNLVPEEKADAGDEIANEVAEGLAKEGIA